MLTRQAECSTSPDDAEAVAEVVAVVKQGGICSWCGGDHVGMGTE